MTGSATESWKCVRRSAAAAALAFAIAAVPAAARDDENVNNRDPSMRDIAATPITDLNLTRDEIPELLQQAAVSPYDASGLDGCAELGEQIALLDRVLGPDLDVDTSQRRDITFGKVAKSAVGSLIPFRGLIREVTGAADHQRDFEQAILAGAIRRGYLKGLGEQRGCAYPARPAFTKVNVTKEDGIDIEEGSQLNTGKTKASAKASDDDSRFYSEPVVQKTGD